LKCASPEDITIAITTPGEFFTEYSGETISNSSNCDYGVGCLFYDLPISIYPGDLPIYVEDRKIRSGCFDPPTFSPGSTTSDCDGVLTIDWADKATCKANTICYGSDGAVTLSFGEDRSEFSHYCRRSDGGCNEMYICPETGQLVKAVSIDCDLIDPDTNIGNCSMAKNEERTDGGQVVNPTDRLTPDELLAFPIPFLDHFTLRFESASAGLATINVVDVAGRTVYAQSMNTDKGSNEYRVQLDQPLSGGIYFLILKESDGKRRFLKLYSTGK
jgi:Secretion system C-terminal sorting domain